MKVLIVGATGFIGRNLNEFFQNKGYSLLTPSRVELDVLSEESVSSYLQMHDIDVVIHSAIYVGNTAEKIVSEKILQNDLRMYFNFQKHADKFGKMIYFGSGAEYDKRNSICSVKESDLKKGTIPSDAYGLAKYIIGQDIQNSKNIFNLRIFGLFGKYEYWQTTFISGCCCKAIKNIPLSIRQNLYFDYMWIDDFCKIVEWFVNNNPIYHTYNITSGKRIELAHLAEIVKTISGKDLPIFICKKGLGREYTADNTRLLEEVKDLQFTDLEDAIRTLYAWYVEKEHIIDIYHLLYQ